MEDLAMKTIQLLAMAIVAFSSIPFLAQRTGVSAQQSASASATGNHASESAQAGVSANAISGGAQANGTAAAQPLRLRPVTGELQGKLDSKSARVGDHVVLKTEQSMKTAEGTVIPKGSHLLGHVTEVQAHGSGHAASRLGIIFDHAQLRNGQTLAIQSMIESVQPSRAEIAARAMENEDAFAGPAGPPAGGPMAGGPAAGGATMGGSRIGGGGLVGGAAGGVTGTAGQLGRNLGSAAGDAMRAGASAAGEANGLVSGANGALRGAASGAASLGAHGTGIPGVMLDSNASSSVSGVLSTAKKNIHLDAGTQMVVGIAAAPQH